MCAKSVVSSFRLTDSISGRHLFLLCTPVLAPIFSIPSDLDLDGDDVMAVARIKPNDSSPISLFGCESEFSRIEPAIYVTHACGVTVLLEFSYDGKTLKPIVNMNLLILFNCPIKKLLFGNLFPHDYFSPFSVSKNAGEQHGSSFRLSTSRRTKTRTM